MSADELHRLLTASGPRPVLLDVRWAPATGPARDDYLEGHIPGAVFIDLDLRLAAPPGPGGRHPLPDADAFGVAMRDAGVTEAGSVVAYDAATSLAAARAWWLLRYFGHVAVAVLDGGLQAWAAAGGPVATGEEPALVPGGFSARPGAMAVLDAAGAAALALGAGILLDARAPERFRGENEPLDPVAGHIPGARNLPMAETLGADGRFAAPAVLRERFTGAGVGAGLPVGAYCGSGITAAHQLLALELAGHRGALYPGSWSEWITDPSRPIATGPN